VLDTAVLMVLCGNQRRWHKPASNPLPRTRYLAVYSLDLHHCNYLISCAAVCALVSVFLALNLWPPLPHRCLYAGCVYPNCWCVSQPIYCTATCSPTSLPDSLLSHLTSILTWPR